MKYHKYPQRDPIKNYFPLPNELFDLELSPGEIALYACLMRLEDRREYKCLVSYRKLGKYIGMSKKTVGKYVAMLEAKQLIRAEHTRVFTKDGRKYNGCLLYKILPIQGAIDCYHAKQMAKLERDATREKAQRALDADFQPRNSASF